MRKILWVTAALVLVPMVFVAFSPRAQFLLGGALINVSYRLQDHLHAYDLEHEADITPVQVWEEFREQNEMSSSMRKTFPRTSEHPVVALLLCMDARIDSSELAGDTRKHYYIVRTAGSVLGEMEQEMLELAVQNGVRLVVLTRHTDCAAEKLARDPEQRRRYPALAAGVDDRERRFSEFLSRPVIAERIADGRLLVKQMVIDTSTDHLVSEVEAQVLGSGSEAQGHHLH